MHNFALAWDFGVFQGKTYFGDSPMYAVLGKLYKLVDSLDALGVPSLKNVSKLVVTKAHTFAPGEALNGEVVI